MSNLDLLIIGSGISGLSAAISAKEEGADVLVVTKSVPTKNNSVMAQGGINAALGNIKSDSTKLHAKDTLKSSHDLANANMVELLCNEAINAIEFLEKIGVSFSRIDNACSTKGSIAQRKLGGASAPRACYAQDYTGLKIMHTLLDFAISSNIEIKDGLFLLELIKNSCSEVCGGLFFNFNSGKLESIYAKRVLLATGGYGGIYAKNTNSYGSSGDGLAAVFRAGGVLSNMEFVQFHPTTLKGSNILISESARGEGGYLVNCKNERFVDELAPRDVVAKAVFEQISSGNSVYLDLRHIDEQHLKEAMPQELKVIKTYANVDATKELVEIEPAVHYSMGGISVNSNFAVKSLAGCFAVGECSDASVHGANRLGGNSLLEAVAFGRLSAKKALSVAPNAIEQKEQKYNLPVGSGNYNELSNTKKEVAEILNKNVGLLRDEQSLKEAQDSLNRLNIDTLSVSGQLQYNTNLIELLELKNSIYLAKATIKCALERKESRGAHIRVDYTSEDATYTKPSFITIKEL